MMITGPDYQVEQSEDIRYYEKRFGTMRALRALTGTANEVFALTTYQNPYPKGKIGVLEAGSYADLLLVDGDPTKSVSVLADTDHLRLIMKGGTVYKLSLIHIFGTFRISQDYLKKMRKNEPDSAVVQFPYQNDGGVYHYPTALMEEMEQYLSLIHICLCRSESSYRLRFSELGMKGYYLKQIFSVGVPAGIQSTVCLLYTSLFKWTME